MRMFTQGSVPGGETFLQSWSVVEVTDLSLFGDSRAESPKFVVTLDRVEQSLLNKPINFDSDVDMEDETTLGNAGFSQQGEQKSTAAQAGASVRASDAGDGSTEMTGMEIIVLCYEFWSCVCMIFVCF